MSIPKFCFKTVPILPTVYDESLSYIETLSRVAKKLNEVIELVNDFNTSTSELIKQEVGKIYTQFQQEISELKKSNNEFIKTVETELEGYRNTLDNLNQKVDNSVLAINARTDAVIQQNNEYIIRKVTEHVGDVLVVLNPFTGEYVPVQVMIDYLSSLHMPYVATYEDVENSGKTWQEVNDFGATWQDISVRGKNYFNV